MAGFIPGRLWARHKNGAFYSKDVGHTELIIGAHQILREQPEDKRRKTVYHFR